MNNTTTAVATSGENSALQVFGYEGKEIRTAFENGEVWVVAKDVCEVLGYSIDGGISKYIAAVPEEWKGGKRISTLGGIQNLLCLSEQGLYFFLARSDKPKALPFQKWLAGDVLPSIRKHGLYATPSTLEALISDPDTAITLLQKLKDEQTRRRELEAKVIEDYPKVVFHDTIQAIDSEGILVKDMAALLTNAG